MNSFQYNYTLVPIGSIKKCQISFILRIRVKTMKRDIGFFDVNACTCTIHAYITYKKTQRCMVIKYR